ncbi:hypothetical protein PINS_up013967 [Pythium insidiosum]|nr:hypothetical protein PINS_up013967 [Pythium insidiosum]
MIYAPPSMDMTATEQVAHRLAEVEARLRARRSSNGSSGSTSLTVDTTLAVSSPRGRSPSHHGGATERTPLLTPTSPTHRPAHAQHKRLLALKDENGPCPFRRSQSHPEEPTSDMGERAIAQESRRISHHDGKNLVLLRKLSVSEQDVVVCNRVRCGVDPAWFRKQAPSRRSWQFNRSLSVEESRLAETRRRFSATFRRHSNLSRPTPTWLSGLPVPEDDSLNDPALESALPHKVSSPRAMECVGLQDDDVLLTIDTEDNDCCGEDDEIPAGAFTPLGATQLTSREKAMHGRYLIRESFANGSYGQVCAGEDLPSRQQIAIKIIPKSLLHSVEEKQSVIREQLIHRSLDHPHIIKLIDVFEDDGAHYFILERADNGSLSALLTYAGMPEEQCRDVFAQLLSALDYLHRHSIVHHDIKPQNILLHHGKRAIKLCDFGASRAFNAKDAVLPFAGVFGTPGYIAPELLMGDKVYGPAIDMFSAGILLYEMVFGFMPFYPPSACTYEALEFPRDSKASLQVRDLVARLLVRDPAQRLTASQALAHPWITMSNAGGHSAPPTPVGSPMCSPRGGGVVPISQMLGSERHYRGPAMERSISMF